MPFFFGQAGDLDHLFLSCLVIAHVWLVMSEWMNINPILFQIEVLSHLFDFHDYLVEKVNKKIVYSSLVVGCLEYLAV